MKGYWRRPDLTAEVLDGEGWYDTRDMGMLDSDGFLYIAGRADDMILGRHDSCRCGEHLSD